MNFFQQQTLAYWILP